MLPSRRQLLCVCKPAASHIHTQPFPHSPTRPSHCPAGVCGADGRDSCRRVPAPPLPLLHAGGAGGGVRAGEALLLPEPECTLKIRGTALRWDRCPKCCALPQAVIAAVVKLRCCKLCPAAFSLLRAVPGELQERDAGQHGGHLWRVPRIPGRGAGERVVVDLCNVVSMAYLSGLLTYRP